MTSQKPKTTSHQPLNRKEVLRAGLERLAQQRELRELQRRPQTNTTRNKGGALNSEGSRADIIMKVFAFDFYNVEYYIEYVVLYIVLEAVVWVLLKSTL